MSVMAREHVTDPTHLQEVEKFLVHFPNVTRGLAYQRPSSLSNDEWDQVMADTWYSHGALQLIVPNARALSAVEREDLRLQCFLSMRNMRRPDHLKVGLIVTCIRRRVVEVLRKKARKKESALETNADQAAPAADGIRLDLSTLRELRLKMIGSNEYRGYEYWIQYCLVDKDSVLAAYGPLSLEEAKTVAGLEGTAMPLSDDAAPIVLKKLTKELNGPLELWALTTLKRTYKQVAELFGTDPAKIRQRFRPKSKIRTVVAKVLEREND